MLCNADVTLIISSDHRSDIKQRTVLKHAVEYLERSSSNALPVPKTVQNFSAGIGHMLRLEMQNVAMRGRVCRRRENVLAFSTDIYRTAFVIVIYRPTVFKSLKHTSCNPKLVY